MHTETGVGWSLPFTFGAGVWLLSGCSFIVPFELCEVDEHCDDGLTCVGGECVASESSRISVSANIVGNQIWTADKTYVLETVVFVEPGSSLTITAGTQIFGQQGSALVVQSGGTLRSNGTAAAPVVFSSAAEIGRRAAGDWGGVALLGEAPTNDSNPVLEGIVQQDRARFGGDEPTSSCGVLSYTRIEFAGFPIEADNELNGLTLGGCGSGTLVRFVQVHFGLDDGVEVFGGTVNFDHIVVTRAQDDSLDWDLGWTGAAQFLAIQQDAGGDNGIEGSSNADEPDSEPRTSPTLWNMTLVGADVTASQRAMTLKEGTAGSINNTIMLGHPIEAVDILDADTAAQLMAGNLAFENVLLYDIGVGGMNYFPDDEAVDADEEPDELNERTFFEQQLADRPESLTLGVNPGLVGPNNVAQPGWVPQGNEVIDAGRRPDERPFDGFDEAAEYVGAFEPGVMPWTEGWTAYPAN